MVQLNNLLRSLYIDALNDCKAVVYSWLSKKLSSDTANKAYRILSAGQVNKVCPLEFESPTEVIKTCRKVAAPSPCCSSLNTYIASIQKQMLITDRQAIICATVFGSMLRKAGVLTDIYELCDIGLKDFSIQAINGLQAPWPLSFSLTSLSLCAPEMSLPALPVAERNPGCGGAGLHLLVAIFCFWFSVCWCTRYL